MGYRDDWDDSDDSYGWGGWYRKPKPRIKARGGIKSQSKRGAFGESWWAKRWIAVLESFNIGARLGRGRSYARSGQVLSIDIEKGELHRGIQLKVKRSRTSTAQVDRTKARARRNDS